MTNNFGTKFKRAGLFTATLMLAGLTFSDSIQYSENFSSVMTETDIESAEAWNLSTEEYSQIKQLKNQYRGLLSENLTPLEWLGIFATSDERRNHYAKLFAERQLHTTAAILQFEAAYTDAIRKLSSEESKQARRGDRLLLVTSFQCSSPTCTTQLKKGLDHVDQGGQLEIYVQSKFDDSDLRGWAITNKIPLKAIRGGKITIRQAKGRMLDVKPGIYYTR